MGNKIYQKQNKYVKYYIKHFDQRILLIICHQIHNKTPNLVHFISKIKIINKNVLKRENNLIQKIISHKKQQQQGIQVLNNTQQQFMLTYYNIQIQLLHQCSQILKHRLIDLNQFLILYQQDLYKKKLINKRNQLIIILKSINKNIENRFKIIRKKESIQYYHSNAHKNGNAKNAKGIQGQKQILNHNYLKKNANKTIIRTKMNNKRRLQTKASQKTNEQRNSIALQCHNSLKLQEKKKQRKHGNRNNSSIRDNSNIKPGSYLYFSKNKIEKCRVKSIKRFRTHFFIEHNESKQSNNICNQSYKYKSNFTMQEKRQHEQYVGQINTQQEQKSKQNSIKQMIKFRRKLKSAQKIKLSKKQTKQKQRLKEEEQEQKEEEREEEKEEEEKEEEEEEKEEEEKEEKEKEEEDQTKNIIKIKSIYNGRRSNIIKFTTNFISQIEQKNQKKQTQTNIKQNNNQILTNKGIIVENKSSSEEEEEQEPNKDRNSIKEFQKKQKIVTKDNQFKRRINNNNKLISSIKEIRNIINQEDKINKEEIQNKQNKFYTANIQVSTIEYQNFIKQFKENNTLINCNLFTYKHHKKYKQSLAKQQNRQSLNLQSIADPKTSSKNRNSTLIEFSTDNNLFQYSQQFLQRISKNKLLQKQLNSTSHYQIIN